MIKYLLIWILLATTAIFGQSTGLVAPGKQPNEYSGKQIFDGGALFLGGVNAQTGTTYAVVASDENKVVSFSNAGSVAVTLPVATTSGFGVGAVFHWVNLGAGTVTVTPTTSTINGAATLVLTTGQSTDVYSDGTNYLAFLGSGTGGGGGSGTVSNCSTATALAYYAGTGTTVSCDSNITDASGVISALGFIGTGPDNGQVLWTYTGTNPSGPSTSQFAIEAHINITTPWTLVPAAAAATGVMYGTDTSNYEQMSFIPLTNTSGTKIQTAAGTLTTGHCPQYNSSGDLIDSGSATCGGSGIGYPSGTGIVQVTGGSAWGSTLSTTGSGNVVLATSPTLVTPALGAATATSLIASGIVDGQAPLTINTSGTFTFGGGTYQSGYTISNDGSTAVTGTLPTAVAGAQFCVRNIATATSTLKILTSATGQFIDNAGGYTATGGYVISGGALADSACVVGIDSTHWELYIQSGTWTTH